MKIGIQKDKKGKNEILFIILLLVLFMTACTPYKYSVYNQYKYKHILNLIQQNEQLIEDSYNVAADLMEEYQGTFLYISPETIVIYDHNNKSNTIKNETKLFQTLFKRFNKLGGITVETNRITYGGWGNLVSSIGFVYCPTDDLTIYEMGAIDKGAEITVIEDAYYWEQSDGDNTVFLKRMQPCFFYYELWW